MKLFTEQILESNRRFNVVSNKEMKDYVDKMGKHLPEEIRKIINLLIRYNITDESILNRIIHGSATDLKIVSKDTGVSSSNIEELKKCIDRAGEENIRMLPLLITDEDRKSLMNGDKDPDDITLDLTSEKGRSRIVKQYSKLAVSIAAKYRGKCGLDWNSLVSAANMGLVKAMNDYKRNTHSDIEDDKMKKLSFKQYAGWRINQQILNDINNYSRTVRVTQHGFEKAKKEGRSFSTVRIDMTDSDGENGNLADRLPGMTTDPVAGKIQDTGQMEKIYDMIDKKFPDKTTSIFYSYFGLHGYKKMTGVELSKQYGITGAAVSQRVKSVITWLQNDKKTRPLLQELLDIYSESLISGNYRNLEETLIGDDMFECLVEGWKYSSPKYNINRIGDCLDNLPEKEAIMIEKCIISGDINFIDDNYDDHKESMNLFCSMMYPTQSGYSDTDIIEKLLSVNKHLKDLEIL